MRRLLFFTILISSTLLSNPVNYVSGQNGVETQMAILLDGSGSISLSDFNIMLEGLADAVNDSSCVPSDGSVELTIVQFGGTSARVEIGPVVLDSGNVEEAVDNITAISKIGSTTPIACAFNMAADALKNSTNFATELRQVINLVTDGRANVCCSPGEYTGSSCDGLSPQESAEVARNYTITELGMTVDDAINSEAIGTNVQLEWLRTDIVYPQPGYYAPPFNESGGWVREVENVEEFAETICQKFRALLELPVVTIDKDVTTSPPVVQNGSTVEYNISISNIGGVDITDVRVWDELQDFFNVSDPPIWSNTTSAGVTKTDDNDFTNFSNPVWGNYSIPSGENITITFTVNVSPDTPFGTYDDTAYMNYTFDSESETIFDDGLIAQDHGTPSNQDPEDDEDITVISNCSVIDKDVVTDPPIVAPGGQVIYKVSLTNTFDTEETGYFVRDPLPTGFTYNDTVGVAFSTGSMYTISDDDFSDPTEPRWGNFTLASGGSVTITYIVDVAKTASEGVYDNTAEGYCPVIDDIIDDLGTIAQDPDTPLGSDPETDEDVEVQRPRILIDKDILESPALFEAGENATYQILVSNSGNTTAFNVTIWDVLPSGFTYQSTENTTEVDSTRTSVVNPALGDTVPEWGNWTINQDGSVTIVFTVKIGEDVPVGVYDDTGYSIGENFDEIDDLGTVAQDEDTPEEEDPEGDEDVTVSEPMVLIDKDVLTDPPVITPGESVQYKIWVENTGAITARNLTIWDLLPTGFMYTDTDSINLYAGASRSSLSDDFSDSNMPLWGNFTVPEGGIVEVTFTVVTDNDLGSGTYENTAYSTGDNFDEVDDDGTLAQDQDTPDGEDPEDDEDIQIVTPVGGELLPNQLLSSLLLAFILTMATLGVRRHHRLP